MGWTVMELVRDSCATFEQRADYAYAATNASCLHCLPDAADVRQDTEGHRHPEPRQSGQMRNWSAMPTALQNWVKTLNENCAPAAWVKQQPKTRVHVQHVEQLEKSNARDNDLVKYAMRNALRTWVKTSTEICALAA